MTKLLSFYNKTLFLMFIFSSLRIIAMADCPIQGELINKKEQNSILDDCCLNFLTDKNITPENTIFAFDVHEVLFDRNKPKIVWGGLKLFCKCFLYLLTHPLFILKLVETFKQHTVFEGMYAQIIDEYPYWERFKPDFLEISNSPCYPIEPMINLLETLKEKGFKIYMLSNMGEETWQDFVTRFESIVELFDGFYTPNKKNNYVGKPMLEFYNEFKDYLKLVGCEDMQIIFVDDMKKNTKGAEKAEINAIHFTGHRNLCEILAHLNVAIE